MAPRLWLLTGCLSSALGGALLALWLWGGTAATAPALPPPAVPALPSPPPPAAAVEPPAPPPAPPAPKAGGLRLPDGSEVEPLNGVLAPPAMVWGEGPYSPIVGRETSNGVDWYVHRDGTRSTTLDRWRSDLGRLDSVTLVARPKAPVPVDDGGAGNRR